MWRSSKYFSQGLNIPRRASNSGPTANRTWDDRYKNQIAEVFQTKQQDDGPSSGILTANLSVMNKSSVNCGLENLWSHPNRLGWLLPAWRRRSSITSQCASAGRYKNTTFEPGSDQRIQLINSEFGYEKKLGMLGKLAYNTISGHIYSSFPQRNGNSRLHKGHVEAI